MFFSQPRAFFWDQLERKRSLAGASIGKTPAWAKNDHPGFEVVYVFEGVVRKFRPDFLVRLTGGTLLVLEVKGQDSAQNQTKRKFLGEWVQAVNQHGGFGRWAWDVSRLPADVHDILARHNAMAWEIGQTPAAKPMRA